MGRCPPFLHGQATRCLIGVVAHHMTPEVAMPLDRGGAATSRMGQCKYRGCLWYSSDWHYWVSWDRRNAVRTNWVAAPIAQCGILTSCRILRAQWPAAANTAS